MATWDLREAVNISAEELPPEIDEFELAGLEKVPSRLVKAMRVKRSPIQFECKYLNTLRFPGDGLMGNADVVFVKVVAIHIADEVLDANGMVDILKVRPIARMGYVDYTSVDSKFSMVIPDDQRALLGGLEGSPDKVILELTRNA